MVVRETTKLVNLEDFKVYGFYDTDGQIATLLINEKDPEKVEELVDEYRRTDAFYDIHGLVEFLEERGYQVIWIETEHSIYF